MTSQGNSISTHGDMAEKINNFRYPCNLTLSALAVPSTTKIVGHLNHKHSCSQVFPFSSSLGIIGIETTQDAAGELVIKEKGSALSGLGRTIQLFTYKDGKGGWYTQDVDIYDSTKIIRDKESGTLLPAIKTESLTAFPSSRPSPLPALGILGDTQIPARVLRERGHPHPPAGIRWHWRVSASG
ncbi:hypothetical protein PGTUg99_004105 [Puccinia graminis f. sp. tritici]|uniref:Uncharacterized protein n=2 Tax=Puccinia graminis f. sp. tritici TaxID=56615 RepID=A0A5B0P8V7_PUCGR|nr:hypothetical protein PGTUg99_004105 [Puccinia graminis f. sp. tritici]